MNMLDLFSGIGGFHLGLEQAGFKFDWVGFSEIDKYANKQYNKRFPNATELGSITDVRCEDLPKHIDILCGGFPCQAFSIAGLRKGFEDTRGTLFFEIARILRHYKDSENPIPYFILENVKGLLNHDDGRTFATIYGVLTDLDYSVECQLLNTRWFLPQNRERIYIVGHLGGRGRSKVFPIGKTEGKNSTCAEGGITGAVKQGWGQIQNDATYLKQEVMAYSKSHRTDNVEHRIKNDEFNTLSTGKGCTNQSSANYIKILGNLKGEDGHECHNVHDTNGIAPTVRHNHGKVTMIEEKKIKRIGGIYGQSTRWGVYDEEGISPTITKAMGDGGGHIPMIEEKPTTSIRRLTPTECERLQGFPDGWTEGQSDTQRYKQLGNAVSVPVVKAVGDKLKKLINGK